MEQINFRVNHEEKEIFKKIADIKGMTITELVKRGALHYIRSERVNLAFELLKEGKIGRKKTWVLSGLSAKEFLDEWQKRDAEVIVPDGIMEKMKENAKYLNFSPNKHRKLHKEK